MFLLTNKTHFLRALSGCALSGCALSGRALSVVGMLVLLAASASNASAQAFADFALGGQNICAIDADGALECTTRFDANTFLPPDDGTLYEQVVSGGAHSCAITQENEVRCWGQNSFGQLNNVPISSASFISLSAGENHTCALDADGQAFCWGLNTNGQTDVPADSPPFVSIHAGELGTCGLTITGDAVCWSNDFVFTTQFLFNRTGWTDFAFPGAGSQSPACGLIDGFIQCWSNNPQLPLPGNGPYTQIETNSIFFCGLQTGGQIDCNVRAFGGTSPTDAVNQETLAEINALPPLVDFQLGNSGPSLNGLCGISFDGELLCAGNSLPADNLPGEQLNIPQPFGLEAAIYSDSSGELFWQTDLSSFSSPINGFNIYRDGELLSFTTGNSSFFDDTLQTGSTFVYEVSMVLRDGRESQRSEPLIVTTVSGAQAPSGSTGNTMDSPDYLLSGVEVIRYSATSLEIFWERPVSNTLVTQFDVFRNGEYITSTPGPSFFDDSVTACQTLEYTIAAISRDSRIVALGFASEGTFPGITCP